MSKRLTQSLRGLFFRGSLLAALLLPQLAGAAQPVPVAGVDYIEIAGGAPWRPLAGKIEVVEVFAYWCHHCADFQPKIDAWKKTLPASVRFSYVPLPSDADDAFARAYFAAETIGALGKTHNATFRAVHADSTLPKNASGDEIAAFYAKLGVDMKKYKPATQGFIPAGQLQKAREFALRSEVEGTPTLIVNGRYRVRGRTLDDNLRIASHLVAMEGAALQGAATKPAKPAAKP
jgi:thiol:disulfide interchange protein DsbA